MEGSGDHHDRPEGKGRILGEAGMTPQTLASLRALLQEFPRREEPAAQLISVVLDALEYFEQREDADMLEADGRWVPNEEMKHASALREALEALGVKLP